MKKRNFQLHDGAKGAALAVRVIPRATKNEIVEIQRDGTIKVRLKTSAKMEEINAMLVHYMSEIMGVSAAEIEIVAGMENRSKLVSILNMDSSNAHKRVVENLS